MKRDLASLFDQMSVSWLFIGAESEAVHSETDPAEDGEEKWSFLDPFSLED